MLSVPFRAILFDVDGTLVNNMMVHHQAWQQKLQELGLSYSIERIKAEINGVNFEILTELFGERFTVAERHQISWDKEVVYREIFAADFSANIVPGVVDFIKQAHRLEIPMAIGTAGPQENAAFVIDNLDIRKYMGHVVHSGMVKRGKPDPEVFQQGADALGIPLQDCLIFEDSVTGARAAQRAGAQAIIMTTTHDPVEFDGLPVTAFLPNFTGLSLEKTTIGFTVKTENL